MKPSQAHSDVNYGALHEEVLHPGDNNGSSISRTQNRISSQPPLRSYPPPPTAQNNFGKPPLINIHSGSVAKPFFKERVYQPYFTYLVTLVQLAMFIYQLFNSNQVMGSMIQTRPFNFLIGPSAEMLINQGGRFVPCMKPLQSLSPSFRCPSSSNQLTLGTSSFQSSLPTCSLEQLCGLGGFPSGIPDQWFRFILPIFLHGGVLHIIFNLLAQLSLGSNLERKYGPIRIAIIYFSAGIGGFLLGANLSPSTVSKSFIFLINTVCSCTKSKFLAAVGASGAIFGLIACDLADLLLNWNIIYSPWCEFLKVLLSIIISFALGLIPVVDNFSHIGGFLFGLLASGFVMPSYRNPSQKRKFTLGFLLVFSILCGVALALVFYFTINGFYHGDWAASCPNCKYLNCLPVGDLCQMFSASQ